jgi:hypothetical protein
MNSLAFLITLQCPLACPHCIVDSNPRRTEKLDTDLVLQLIDEAATLGIETIGFTGGEPFLRPHDLGRFFDRCTMHGMKTIIITSAFFARSEDHAYRTLEPFSGLYMLWISTDDYHQQFTRISNVRHAIRAAKRLRMDRIEIQVAYLDDGAVDVVRAELGEDADGVDVRGQVVWPVGQAAQLLRGSENALVPVEDLDLRCPMYGPVVTPDCKVKGCCSSLLNLGDRNPLVLGDVSQESLSTIVEGARSHGYYNFLKVFGLVPILSFLRQQQLSDKIKPGYTDVCHLCHDIHSDDALSKLLTGTFG